MKKISACCLLICMVLNSYGQKNITSSKNISKEVDMSDSIAKAVFKVIKMAGDNFKTITGSYTRAINDSVNAYAVKGINTRTTGEFILLEKNRPNFYVGTYDASKGDMLLFTSALLGLESIKRHNNESPDIAAEKKMSASGITIEITYKGKYVGLYSLDMSTQRGTLVISSDMSLEATLTK